MATINSRGQQNLSMLVMVITGWSFLTLFQMGSLPNLGSIAEGTITKGTCLGADAADALCNVVTDPDTCLETDQTESQTVAAGTKCTYLPVSPTVTRPVNLNRFFACVGKDGDTAAPQCSVSTRACVNGLSDPAADGPCALDFTLLPSSPENIFVITAPSDKAADFRKDFLNKNRAREDLASTHYYAFFLMTNLFVVLAAHRVSLQRTEVNGVARTNITNILWLVTIVVVTLLNGAYLGEYDNHYRTVLGAALFAVGLMVASTTWIQGEWDTQPKIVTGIGTWGYKARYVISLLMVIFGAILQQSTKNIGDVAILDFWVLLAFIVSIGVTYRLPKTGTVNETKSLQDTMPVKLLAGAVTAQLLLVAFTGVKFLELPKDGSISNAGGVGFVFAWASSLAGAVILVGVLIAPMFGCWKENADNESTNFFTGKVALQPTTGAPIDRASLVRNNLKLDLNV